VVGAHMESQLLGASQDLNPALSIGTNSSSSVNEAIISSIVNNLHDIRERKIKGRSDGI